MTGYGHLGPARARRSLRDQLVVENAGAARRIAMRIARKLPNPAMADDVVAAAYLGLTQAAERYDARRGEPFLAFAEQRIRGAVFDELRRSDLLPRRKRQLAKRVQGAMAALEQQKGRAAEDDEVAAYLGVSVAEYQQDLEQLSHVGIVEFEGEQHAAKGEQATPAAATERRDLVTKVLRAIKTLPIRDAQLMSLYYVEGLTYAELAEVFDVSVGRVSQLHARAIARIRAKFDDAQPERRQAA